MHNRTKLLIGTNGQIELMNNRGIKNISKTDEDLLRKKGYFKLYKGYRVIKNEEINDFEEIKQLEQIDRSLKKLLYFPILDIETVIKNTILERISNEDNTTAYYTELLDNKKLCSSSITKKDINKRKARFYNECSSKYDKKHVNHYLNKNEEPPLWAYFEILTFGGISNFLKDLDASIRADIALEILGVANSEVLLNLIYVLNPLRNAIMHNEIIFDVRFDFRININLLLSIRNCPLK